MSPALTRGIHALRGRGKPLPRASQGEFERGFGTEFSDVRVHADASAAELADSLGAQAFTHGTDIAFARGQYEPDSETGRELLAHELTHVVQQRGVGEGTLRRSGGDEDRDEEVVDEYLEPIFDFIEFIELLETCELTALALRARLLIAGGTEPLPTTGEEARRYRTWLMTTAESESLTMDELGVNVAFNAPPAFPLVWADWVGEALELDVDPVGLIEGLTARWTEVEIQALVMPALLWAQGLPVTFENAQRLTRFALSMGHANAEEDHPVRTYARLARAYSAEKGLTAFALGWESMVGEVVDAIEGCVYTPDPLDYEGFLENRQQILSQLPARLRAALTEEELSTAESTAEGLADAALLAGFAGGLYGLMAIFSGWAQASERFDVALDLANGLVGQSGGVERFVAAVTWAWELGYLGEAGAQVVAAILEHGWEILGMTLAIIAAQFVPYLNVAVDVVLMIVSGVDVLATIDALASAVAPVLESTSIVELQRHTPALALALMGDGLMALVDLLLVSVSLRSARVRADALRRADPGLSVRDAVMQALRGADDSASRALRHGAEFETWRATLNAQTRQLLDADAELAALFARMDPSVRRVLTRCSSPCIPTRPRPTAEQIGRIERLMGRFALSGDDIALTEYLFANRSRLGRATEGFDELTRLEDLHHLFDTTIEAYARARGGSARRGADGRWIFTRADGTDVVEHGMGSHGQLTAAERGSNSFFQSHHGAQDAWAEDIGIPGYSRNGAEAILLRNRRKGSPHQTITARQSARRSTRGERTYAQERANTLADLQAAQVPRATIDSYLARQDAYFARLYRQAAANHDAAAMRRWFGDWTP